MKKALSAVMACCLAITFANAQADHKLDSQTVANDKAIMHEILNPALQNARSQNQEPDWKALAATISGQFNSSYADRNITKAKIYYFYGRDWSQFSTALVQYTQNYEYRDSLSLMNKNAKMILDHSQNPADWKAAQSWAKYASDKNPSNDAYRATYDALTDKIAGKQ
ncbi:MAG TPA: hypothetical protein VG605_20485 [Puia sp.]|nr:hypothetical protein [Puia sp.]